MRFSFTEDQHTLAASLRAYLAKSCPPAAVRAVWDDGTGHSPALWRELAEMGVLGMLAPEAAGGMGGTDVDAVLLYEELGRACVPGPVLETMAIAAPALAATAWASALSAGALVVTASIDGGPYVPHARAADLILLRVAVGGLVAVEREAAELRYVDGIDGGRRLYSVFASSSAPVDADVSLAFDRGALAMAAYLIGLGEAMVSMGAVHARERHQFGKPIGVNQAVKHLLADSLQKIEFAKPAVYRAAWSISTDQPTRARDVSMAKCLASEAAYQASRGVMQVHGAMGYTWEQDLQLFMKKAWALMRAHGDATFHRRRVAGAVLGDDLSPDPRQSSVRLLP